MVGSNANDESRPLGVRHASRPVTTSTNTVSVREEAPPTTTTPTTGPDTGPRPIAGRPSSAVQRTSPVATSSACTPDRSVTTRLPAPTSRTDANCGGTSAPPGTRSRVATVLPVVPSNTRRRCHFGSAKLGSRLPSSGTSKWNRSRSTRLQRDTGPHQHGSSGDHARTQQHRRVARDSSLGAPSPLGCRVRPHCRWDSRRAPRVTRPSRQVPEATLGQRADMIRGLGCGEADRG